MNIDIIDKNNCLNNKFEAELIELIHFIRTPLASIKLGSGILKEFFPIFARAYQSSNHQDLTISNDKMDKLYSILDNILVEANRISDYITKLTL
ncbi:hypothetical protein Lnau_2316 [Legionella nautarum]|uniref:Uncharacterized protein n=1 Tax=Legionella nautarum TaxID=45070 RepID=A0A0W0WMK8_9GAMM|nr:hypothetical protein [Legionella nautarum]KTD33565.1 hypothetical protein Lnau_2316 [Legionella nautarum]